MRNHTYTAIICFALLATACRKEKETIDLDYTSAVDNALVESYFNDILRLSDETAGDNGLRGIQASCIDTVIIDTLASPHTMLIDLGPTNCTGLDGRQRRGQLFVTFTGRYRDAGTVITITPQGFHVNDHLVQGTKTVTNLGLNGDGHPFFSVDVDGTVTAPGGAWTSSYQGQRTRTWTQGSATPSLFDDVYAITGSGTGVNRNGIPYTVSITAPLIVELDCPYITQGQLEITPDQRPTRYVDFGNGVCDATITVTVNGNTYTFGGN